MGLNLLNERSLFPPILYTIRNLAVTAWKISGPSTFRTMIQSFITVHDLIISYMLLKKVDTVECQPNLFNMIPRFLCIFILGKL